MMLVGPTGGYILGYLGAVYATGYFAEKFRNKSYLGIFYAMLIGASITLLSGWAHLSHFIGMQKAFLIGVLPFVLGDVLKVLLGVKFLKMIGLIPNKKSTP